MQRLEVSGAVRLIFWSLGVKGLNNFGPATQIPPVNSDHTGASHTVWFCLYWECSIRQRAVLIQVCFAWWKQVLA